MASVGSTSAVSNVTITGTDTNVTIYNFTIVSANTEYSIVFPTDIKKFLIKGRTSFPTKLAYTSGNSGTLFLTIPASTTYTDNNFYSALTIYFQSPQSGVILEIVAFK